MQRNDLLPLSFYEKSPFTGSEGKMCYRIEKHVEDDKKQLKATKWNGPFSYDHTDDFLKTSHFEDFSEEGMENIIKWLSL